MQIAMVARKGEVIGRVGPSMLAGDDVLNVKWKGLAGLRQAAILALSPGALTDEPSQGRIHQLTANALRVCRALAWRMPIKVLALT